MHGPPRDPGTDARARRLAALLAAALLVAGIGAGGATIASAVVVHVGGRAVAILPQAATSPPVAAGVDEDLLTAGGGGALAAASSFPPGYEALIDQYLTDVAVDGCGLASKNGACSATNAGGAGDVYGIEAQYGPSSDQTDDPGVDSSAFVPAADAAVDQDSFPADSGASNPNGCVPASGDYTCLTDLQIRSELQSLIAYYGWDSDLSTLYMVLLPPGVDECLGSGPESASNQCADRDYCAYHSSFTNNTGRPVAPVYVVLPFADGSGCVTGQSPNGNVPADQAISTLSHETIETITDPLMNGWLDASDNEVADKCAADADEPQTVFGAPLGSNSFSDYNQAINGDDYYIQEVYSNLAGGCEQRPGATADTPTLPGPVSYHGGPVMGAHLVRAIYWDASNAPSPSYPSATVSAGSATAPRGQAVTFTASVTSSATSPTLSYAWSFDDGTTATTLASHVAHAFAGSGTHTVTLVAYANGFPSEPASVTLTVTDATEQTTSASQSLTVTATSSDSPPATSSTTTTTTSTTTISATSSGAGNAKAAAAAQAAANRRLAARLLEAEPVSARLVHGRVIVSSGRVLDCPAGKARCTVSVALAVKQVTIGRGTLRIAPGRSMLIDVTLDTAGAKLLRARRRLATVLTITAAADASGAAGHVAIGLTIAAPRPLAGG